MRLAFFMSVSLTLYYKLIAIPSYQRLFWWLCIAIICGISLRLF